MCVHAYMFVENSFGRFSNILWITTMLSELCTKESTLSRVGFSSLMRAADRPTGSHGTMKIRKGTVRMLYCQDTFQLFLSDI